MLIYFEILGVGLTVGLVSSFLGLGGGIFIVPLLPLLLPLSMREVLGTSLFTVFLVAVTNGWRFWRQDMVDLSAALVLGISSAFMAYLGGRLTSVFSSCALMRGLTCVLLLLFISCLCTDKIKRMHLPRLIGFARFLGLAGTGLFTGLIAGFSGIGGGSITGPVLVLTGMVDHRKLAGVGNAAMILTACFGAWGFIGIDQSLAWPRWGLVHLDIAVLIWIGSLFTGVLGLRYQHRISERVRTRLLAGVLLLLILKVGISAFKC